MPSVAEQMPSIAPAAFTEPLEKGLRMPRAGRLPAVLMRAGTSRGLFLNNADLPTNRQDWETIIRSAMGSPDPFLKQLNGVGGGVSTQSKVAVCWKSQEPGIDVEYLFIQVPIDGRPLDFSGNCGNMASGVGPFAVDQGLVAVQDRSLHEHSLVIRNVNTSKLIRSTFLVWEGRSYEFGDMYLDGVSQPGSPIRLDFLEPAGSMTGQLLPTGSPLDVVEVDLDAASSMGIDTPANTTTAALFSPDPAAPRVFPFMVSCIDAANPFIFVSAQEVARAVKVQGGGGPMSEFLSVDSLMQSPSVWPILASIRRKMAVRMGLAKTEGLADLKMGTPRGRSIGAEEIDLIVRPYSMGAPHPTIQMTGACCVASACAVQGTLPWLLKTKPNIDDLDAPGSQSRERNNGSTVELDRSSQLQTHTLRIGHASGIVLAECRTMEAAFADDAPLSGDASHRQSANSNLDVHLERGRGGRHRRPSAASSTSSNASLSTLSDSHISSVSHISYDLSSPPLPLIEPTAEPAETQIVPLETKAKTRLATPENRAAAVRPWPIVESASVYRTARTLMEGVVRYATL